MSRNKDAFRLEKYLLESRPLIAKPTEKAKQYDKKLAEDFRKDETKEFDGVVYYPKTKEIYCSFYNKKEQVAVLISVTELEFHNDKIQEKVNIFINKYYKNKR